MEKKILWFIFIFGTFMALTLPKTTATYIGYPLFVAIYAIVFVVIKRTKGGSK